MAPIAGTWAIAHLKSLKHIVFIRIIRFIIETFPFFIYGGTMTKTILVSIVFFQICCCHAVALERFDIITTEELEHLLAQREKGDANFLLINTLDEIIYRNSSIPGSINIPWSRLGETIHRAGDDKERLLVMY